jgi:hypothetical protein
MEHRVVSAPPVHVRCGSDIRRSLQEAGVAGRFVEFSDPVCQGPVPDGLDDAAFETVRARFIATAYGGGEAGCLRRLRGEAAALDAIADDETILLWFEHDIFDQAVLIRLLDRLGRQPARRGRTWLIAIDRFPGVDRFIGLGQLSAEQLASLPATARPVTEDQFALGSAAWRAFRQSDPADLWALVETATPALPLLAGALRRHLLELPGREDGLALTERLCLRAVADGAGSPGEVFAALRNGLEPQPFLGDIMLWPILQHLADAPEPALMPFAAWNDALALTPFGQALLAGEADWCAANGIDRWLGGIRLSGTRPAWRWDAAAGRPGKAG